ncbi:MAG: hypothetical protein HPY85_12555 [Anaerolineae bacterium]|nr:hypothetical protein [Anaerolineae bacterium]
MRLIKRILRFVPTLLLSAFLALIVWASAITAADPNEERLYPSNLPVDVIGLDPGLIMVSQSAVNASITLSAPTSVWAQLTRDPGLISMTADLSGLGVGKHTVPIEVDVNTNPVRVISVSPRNLAVELDTFLERELPVTFEVTGLPAVGFESEAPTLSTESISIQGASQLVEQVVVVRASLDITDASQSFVTTLPLSAYDEAGREVTGLTLSPSDITVTQPITQKYGYRNLVVKVVVKGTVAGGYRVTNVSSYPAVVTVFSVNPDLVLDLPGYVETEPLDITGAVDDVDVLLPLALPSGVSVVGENQVQVQVGIAAIESSLTLSNMRVELVGVDEGLVATVSPEVVDVILSGPLPVLDKLRATDVRVFIDMTDVPEGVYQRVPQVEILVQGLLVQSVLPESVEVELEINPTHTITPDDLFPTLTATPRRTATLTPTRTPTKKP